MAVDDEEEEEELLLGDLEAAAGLASFRCRAVSGDAAMMELVFKAFLVDRYKYINSWSRSGRRDKNTPKIRRFVYRIYEKATENEDLKSG